MSKCHRASCLLCVIVFFFLILGDTMLTPDTAVPGVVIVAIVVVVVVSVVADIISFQCSKAEPRANM